MTSSAIKTMNNNNEKTTQPNQPTQGAYQAGPPPNWEDLYYMGYPFGPMAHRGRHGPPHWAAGTPPPPFRSRESVPPTNNNNEKATPTDDMPLDSDDRAATPPTPPEGVPEDTEPRRRHHGGGGGFGGRRHGGRGEHGGRAEGRGSGSPSGRRHPGGAGFGGRRHEFHPEGGAGPSGGPGGRFGGGGGRRHEFRGEGGPGGRDGPRHHGRRGSGSSGEGRFGGRGGPRGPGGPWGHGFGGRHGGPDGMRGGFGDKMRTYLEEVLGGVGLAGLAGALPRDTNDQHPFQQLWTPKPDADVFDTKEAWIIHLSLPGARKADVDVSYNTLDKTVRVAGVVHRPDEVDEDMLACLSQGGRRVGEFEKIIRLEGEGRADGDGLAANLEDGVLRVEVPKVYDDEWTHVKRVGVA